MGIITRRDAIKKTLRAGIYAVPVVAVSLPMSVAAVTLPPVTASGGVFLAGSQCMGATILTLALSASLSLNASANTVYVVTFSVFDPLNPNQVIESASQPITTNAQGTFGGNLLTNTQLPNYNRALYPTKVTFRIDSSPATGTPLVSATASIATLPTPCIAP